MWRRHEKYMNTPCTKMNKAEKGHFWFSLEMKWRIALKKEGIHLATGRIHPKNMNQTHSKMNPPVQ